MHILNEEMTWLYKRYQINIIEAQVILYASIITLSALVMLKH